MNRVVSIDGNVMMEVSPYGENLSANSNRQKFVALDVFEGNQKMVLSNLDSETTQRLINVLQESLDAINGVAETDSVPNGTITVNVQPGQTITMNVTGERL